MPSSSRDKLLQQMTINDVSNLLIKLNLPKYIDSFRDKSISGLTLSMVESEYDIHNIDNNMSLLDIRTLYKHITCMKRLANYTVIAIGVSVISDNNIYGLYSIFMPTLCCMCAQPSPANSASKGASSLPAIIINNASLYDSKSAPSSLTHSFLSHLSIMFVYPHTVAADAIPIEAGSLPDLNLTARSSAAALQTPVQAVPYDTILSSRSVLVPQPSPTHHPTPTLTTTTESSSPVDIDTDIPISDPETAPTHIIQTILQLQGLTLTDKKRARTAVCLICNRRHVAKYSCIPYDIDICLPCLRTIYTDFSPKIQRLIDNKHILCDLVVTPNIRIYNTNCDICLQKGYNKYTCIKHNYDICDTCYTNNNIMPKRQHIQCKHHSCILTITIDHKRIHNNKCNVCLNKSNIKYSCILHNFDICKRCFDSSIRIH